MQVAQGGRGPGQGAGQSEAQVAAGGDARPRVGLPELLPVAGVEVE